MQRLKQFIIFSALLSGTVSSMSAKAEDDAVSKTAPAFEVPKIVSDTEAASKTEDTGILQKKTSTEKLTAFSNPLAALGNDNNRPKVFIAGKPILVKKHVRTFVQNKLLDHLPPALRFQRIRAALENRTNISVFPHSPRRGRSDAPVVILELTDLSCLQCSQQLQQIDDIREKYKDKILQIHTYVPVDRYNTSNPAAFYSRLAHDSGSFWEYRDELFSIEDLSEQSLVSKLIASGVDIQHLRQNVRQNARQYYRELDADSQLAGDLGILRPPAIFVNGVRIGAAVKMEQLEELIKYEIKVSEQIRVEEK